MEARDTLIEEDKLYVAVGKDSKESELTLQWAFDNSGGRKICILHVHQPADRLPMGLGGKFPVSQMDDRLVSEYHEKQRQNMLQLLDYYCRICRNSRVPVETQHIEMESIKRGIIELILQHGVRRLVMGAAAARLYSKQMMKLKSEKAKYVCEHAPASCHIWFICKGNLIFTRNYWIVIDGPVNEDSWLTFQIRSNQLLSINKSAANHARSRLLQPMGSPTKAWMGAKALRP